MKKRLLKYILLLVLGINTVQAQHEMTLFHFHNVYQSAYVNPVSIPENNLSIGLPGLSSVYANLVLPNFTANDLQMKQGDSSVWSLTNVVKKMNAGHNNILHVGASVDLLHIRVKIRNVYVSLGAREVIDINTNLPKDLFGFINDGNAQFINGQATFDGLGVNATHYREYALGLTRHKDGGKLTYGARFKFLQGFENINTTKSNISWAIDNNYYATTLNTDIAAKSSFVDSSMSFSNPVGYLTDFSNPGWGLDLGITYRPIQKLDITATVNNIGMIFWNKNTKEYTLNHSETLNGVNIDSVNGSFRLIELTSPIMAFGENLKNTNTAAYSTILAPSVYLSVGYQLARRTKISITGYNRFNGYFNPVGAVVFYQGAGRFLNLLVSYTIRNQSYNNVGGGLMLKLLGFQIYVVADNILGAFKPLDASLFNLRAGINLVYINKRKPDAGTHNEE